MCEKLYILYFFSCAWFKTSKIQCLDCDKINCFEFHVFDFFPPIIFLCIGYIIDGDISKTIYSMGAPIKCCAKRGLCCRKLFTKEDPIFFHKIFGLLALLSFLYRYGYVYPTKGNLGFDGSWFDWINITCHMILSSSSIIFHVLAYRIYDKPMIIWEEYRLHAIVFTLRCVSVFAYATLVPLYFPEFYKTIYSRLTLPALVLTHHLVVDEITRRFGPKDPNRTTVRSTGKEAIPLWQTSVYRFYSFYQFAALGSHLVPHDRLADAGYNTLIAIQSSAFLMTLFRKGLIRNYSHAGWYTACLIVSIFHIFKFQTQPFFYAVKIMGAFLLRTKLRVNKYYLWIGFVLFSIPAIENYFYNKIANNLLQSDFNKLQSSSSSVLSGLPELQFFDLSQRLASARSYANSYSSLDFDTARQTVLAADRTTVLASAAVLLLTWYVMISNTASTTTLRRAASNNRVAKYFGLGPTENSQNTKEHTARMKQAMSNSMQDLQQLGKK